MVGERGMPAVEEAVKLSIEVWRRIVEIVRCAMNLKGRGTSRTSGKQASGWEIKLTEQWRFDIYFQK